MLAGLPPEPSKTRPHHVSQPQAQHTTISRPAHITKQASISKPPVLNTQKVGQDNETPSPVPTPPTDQTPSKGKGRREAIILQAPAPNFTKQAELTQKNWLNFQKKNKK
jgi:hypothetical protein